MWEFVCVRVSKRHEKKVLVHVYVHIHVRGLSLEAFFSERNLGFSTLTRRWCMPRCRLNDIERVNCGFSILLIFFFSRYVSLLFCHCCFFFSLSNILIAFGNLFISFVNAAFPIRSTMSDCDGMTEPEFRNSLCFIIIIRNCHSHFSGQAAFAPLRDSLTPRFAYGNLCVVLKKDDEQ